VCLFYSPGYISSDFCLQHLNTRHPERSSLHWAMATMAKAAGGIERHRRLAESAADLIKISLR